MRNILELIADGKKILTFPKHDIKDYCDVISNSDAHFVSEWLKNLNLFLCMLDSNSNAYKGIWNNLWVIDNHNRLATERVTNIIRILEAITQ